MLASSVGESVFMYEADLYPEGKPPQRCTKSIRRRSSEFHTYIIYHLGERRQCTSISSEVPLGDVP